MDRKSLKTFGTLIQRDLLVFWPTVAGRLIDAFIWGVLTVGVFAFIMPSLGWKGSGAFIACGTIASLGFFQSTDNATQFVGDLQGDFTLSYDLTLPIKPWLVFVGIALSNALQSMFVAIWFLPLFKLMLGDAFSFTDFSVAKFSLIFVLIHLFYGFFSLYVISVIGTVEEVGNLWWRVIFPLRFIGCFQFTWQVLYGLYPRWALVALLNPLVFTIEGVRSAILGPTAYINFWLCCAATVIFTILAGIIGIKKLKKRLDCI